MTDKGIDRKEIDCISGMRIYLKKMIPVVGIYAIINFAYSYYQFGILKNTNFDEVINPVFIISSAIYWIIMFYYNRKYTRIQICKNSKA